MKKRHLVSTSVVALAIAASAFSFTARSSMDQRDVRSVDAAEESVDESSEEQASAGPGAAEEPAQAVVVDDVIAVNELQPRQYAGRLVPIDDVEIVPRVTGWIEKINFKEGDVVNEGDLLLEIEDTTYQAALATAEGNLAKAQAQEKYAQTDYDRKKELLDRQAGSQADFDNAEQSLNGAKAGVKIAEAALLDARNTLSYTKIVAPITGRIGKVAVTRGNLVTPQTGKIADIKSFSPIYVRFAIGESVFNKTFGGRDHIRDLAKIKICAVGDSREDQKAIENYPDATIELIDNKVDPSTNTIVIWATIENEDGRFLPGSYATALLSKKLSKPARGVILSAVQTASDGNYVYVVGKDGRAERRLVKLGVISGKYQIVDEGLEIGETIVIEGQNKLKEGSMIEPVRFDEDENLTQAPQTVEKTETAE